MILVSVVPCYNSVLSRLDRAKRTPACTNHSILCKLYCCLLINTNTVIQMYPYPVRLFDICVVISGRLCDCTI